MTFDLTLNVPFWLLLTVGIALASTVYLAFGTIFAGVLAQGTRYTEFDLIMLALFWPIVAAGIALFFSLYCLCFPIIYLASTIAGKPRLDD